MRAHQVVVAPPPCEGRAGGDHIALFHLGPLITPRSVAARLLKAGSARGRHGFPVLHNRYWAFNSSRPAGPGSPLPGEEFQSRSYLSLSCRLHRIKLATIGTHLGLIEHQQQLPCWSPESPPDGQQRSSGWAWPPAAPLDRFKVLIVRRRAEAGQRHRLGGHLNLRTAFRGGTGAAA